MATQTTTVRLPDDLRKKAKKLADKFSMTFSALVTAGLRSKVAELEESIRKEAEQKSRGEEAARERRKRALKLDDERLAPETPVEDEQDDENVDEDASVLDPPDALYLHHAEKIVESYDDVTERRLAAQEAIKAICSLRPLTADPLIVERRLHKLVTKLRGEKKEQSPKTPEPAPKKEKANGDSSIIERILGSLSASMKTEPETEPDNREENE